TSRTTRGFNCFRTDGRSRRTYSQEENDRSRAAAAAALRIRMARSPRMATACTSSARRLLVRDPGRRGSDCGRSASHAIAARGGVREVLELDRFAGDGELRRHRGENALQFTRTAGETRGDLAHDL